MNNYPEVLDAIRNGLIELVDDKANVNTLNTIEKLATKIQDNLMKQFDTAYIDSNHTGGNLMEILVQHVFANNKLSKKIEELEKELLTTKNSILEIQQRVRNCVKDLSDNVEDFNIWGEDV